MKVEILISDITRLALKTRMDEGGQVTTVQFDAKIPAPSIARLLNLQRQVVPILVTIGSPQAMMDLIITEDKAEAQPSSHPDLFTKPDETPQS